MGTILFQDAAGLDKELRRWLRCEESHLVEMALTHRGQSSDLPWLGPNGRCCRTQRTVPGRQANRTPHRQVRAGQRCTRRVPFMSGWIVQPNG